MAFNSLLDFEAPGLHLEDEENQEKVILLSLEQIEIWEQQPRNYIDPQEISELAKSLQQFEQLAPIIVRPHPQKKHKYLVVAGEKRYHASVEANKSEIEAKIKDLDEIEAYELALIENRQRSGLNPIDDTLATLTLIEKKTKKNREEVIRYLHRIGNKQDSEVPIEFWETVEQVFERTCSLSINTFVKKRLRLLNLPDFILQAIQKGEISYPNAVMFVKLSKKNEESARKILEKAIAEKWSRDRIQTEIKKLTVLSHEFKSSISPEETKNSLKQVYSRLSRSQKILNDPKKQKKLQKIIKDMENLLESA